MATILKPIICKGAVSRVAGAPLQMEEVVVAPPKAGEVRVKIICTSLCHTDVTCWRIEGSNAIFPTILGHEAVGTVESVGEGVTEVVVGDLVISICIAQCMECVDCVSEKSNICSGLPFFRRTIDMARDGTSRFTSKANGEVLHHFLNVSSFIEYTVVDIGHIVKIDRAMPPKYACLLSCGILTGIGAAWKVASIEAGSSVAIFGLGAVGLGVAEGARLRGASKIIGVDLNPVKFDTGRKIGVTDFINPKEIGERSISEVIKEKTGGGADYCFECIGLAPLMSTAFESSRPGWGKTVILGLEMNGSPISLNNYEILQGKSLAGAMLGGIKSKIDIPILVRQYLDKELKLDEFITHEINFGDINKSFDLLNEGKSVKCIIWMDN